VAFNPHSKPEKLTVQLHGRGLTADQSWQLEIPATGTVQREFTVRLGDNIPNGRQVFCLDARDGDLPDGGDSFLVVDVD
jgi:hypothetical protein